MDIVNGRPVEEAGSVLLSLGLRPNIESFRRKQIKELFESWFNWPHEDYAPDFIIVHPRLKPFLEPFMNDSVDVIFDTENEFQLSIRIAILGKYKIERSQSIDGDAPDS